MRISPALLALLLVAPAARATSVPYSITARASMIVLYYDPDIPPPVYAQQKDYWTITGTAELDPATHVWTFDASPSATPIPNVQSPPELDEYSWLWTWSDELRLFPAGRSVALDPITGRSGTQYDEVAMGELTSGSFAFPVRDDVTWSIDCSSGSTCTGVSYFAWSWSPYRPPPMYIQLDGGGGYEFSASVPEPAAALLVVGAALGALARSKVRRTSPSTSSSNQ